VEVVVASSVAHSGLGDHVLGGRAVVADRSDSGRIDDVAGTSTTGGVLGLRGLANVAFTHDVAVGVTVRSWSELNRPVVSRSLLTVCHHDRCCRRLLICHQLVNIDSSMLDEHTSTASRVNLVSHNVLGLYTNVQEMSLQKVKKDESTSRSLK
jgi:hypothetical protein